MSARTPLCLLLLAAPALAAPQDPAEVLATYKLEGRTQNVTRADVALEMAFHLRRRDRGREACEMIVDTLVTRTEADAQGLTPTRADAEAFWEQLKDQLRAQGHDPEQFAAVRNTGLERWLEDLAPLGTDSNKEFLEIAPWLIVVFQLLKGADGGQV